MSLTTSATFNPILSEALNKVGGNKFVGLSILPVRNVGTKSGTYPVFDADHFDNDTSKQRAPGSKFARRDFKYSSQDFKCLQYGLEGVLPDEDETQANDDGVTEASGAIAAELQRDLMVGHELRVQEIVYGAAYNSTGATASMSAGATAKPIKDIQNAVERLGGNGFNDNLALIIEESLFNEMLNVDDVRSIFNGNGTYTDRQVLRDALGVSQIIVCPTRYNSAAKGKSATRSKVWPTDKYLVAQVGGGDFANGGIGRTLAYSADGGIFTAEGYRDEGIKSDILRVYNSCDEVVINVNAGELITGV